MQDCESIAYDRFAELYDLMMGDRQPFVDFYSGLLEPSQISLLDVGCGTGTITVALARALRAMRNGQPVRVAGLDGSSRMLQVAASHDASIEWIGGDLRAIPTKGPFDLAICAFNTLQHVDGPGLGQAFRSTRSVLAEGALFAFDIYKPNLDYLSLPQRNRLARDLAHPDGRRLEIREDTDFDDDSQVLAVTWRLVEAGKPEAPPLAETCYRMWQHEPDDVARALADNGFSIVERFGALDRSPYLPASKKQVIVCRAI